MKKLLVILFVAIMMVSITACGPTIKIGDSEVSLKDGEVEIKTEEGTASVKEGELSFEDKDGNEVFEANEKGVGLPDGYPENMVPIIDDSMIIMASNQDQEYWLTAITKKDLKDTAEFYKDVMSDAEDLSTVTAEGMNMITGYKDNFYITISLTPSDENENETAVNIWIAKEE